MQKRERHLGPEAQNDARTKTPHPRPSGSPPDTSRLHVLQRYAGNQAVARWLGQKAGSERHRAAEPEAERGRPLDGRTRSRMESAFGQDFADVRVHTDAEAASRADRLGARAFTEGQSVSFGQGQYRPGTLVGDALVAHELAHVVQQQDAVKDGAERAGGAAYESLERDANRSALGVLSALWQGTKQVVAGASGRARPALRSGLRLQRCSKAERIEAPAYMGPHSRETLERINEIAEAGGLLQDAVTYGPVIAWATGPPSTYPLEEQVQAAQAVPVITRNRILQQIDLLYLEHGNDLSQEERAFWDRLRTIMNQ